MAALPDNSCHNRDGNLDLRVVISLQLISETANQNPKQINNIKPQKQNQNLKQTRKNKQKTNERRPSQGFDSREIKEEIRVVKETRKLPQQRIKRKKHNIRVSMKHSKIWKEEEKKFTDD